jgi:hypothetical protein
MIELGRHHGFEAEVLEEIAQGVVEVILGTHAVVRQHSDAACSGQRPAGKAASVSIQGVRGLRLAAAHRMPLRP